MKSTADDFQSLIKFLIYYLKIKIVKLAIKFENFKNWSVDILMFKRGMLQSKVWHGSMIGLSAFGILTSGVFGNQTIVSSSFPGVGVEDPRFPQTLPPQTEGATDDPVLNSLYDTHTVISVKPRSEIIEYEVKSGDTISSIAEKFDISTDTIKWANDLPTLDSIKPAQKIKILPVTGVAHTVKAADNLEPIAKKYSVDSQAILNFPFNDIGEDFKLKVGQVLIVPDGVPPQAPPPKLKPQPQYLASGPSSPSFSAPGGAQFIWPTTGSSSSHFSWYHPGVDIPNKSAPAVAAADGGVVEMAGWPDGFGYGNRVVINHGNGYTTLYAHLSNIYVAVGQTVSRGQTIAKMGSTGRSTGTHLHFEMRYKGIAVNPLSILK